MESYPDLKKEIQLLKKQNNRLLLGLNIVAIGSLIQALVMARLF